MVSGYTCTSRYTVAHHTKYTGQPHYPIQFPFNFQHIQPTIIQFHTDTNIIQFPPYRPRSTVVHIQQFCGSPPRLHIYLQTTLYMAVYRGSQSKKHQRLHTIPFNFASISQLHKHFAINVICPTQISRNPYPFPIQINNYLHKLHKAKLHKLHKSTQFHLPCLKWLCPAAVFFTPSVAHLSLQHLTAARCPLRAVCLLLARCPLHAVRLLLARTPHSPHCPLLARPVVLSLSPGLLLLSLNLLPLLSFFATTGH